MTLLAFIYIYRIDMNIERLMPCSKKHKILSLEKSHVQLSLSCFLLMILIDVFKVCIFIFVSIRVVVNFKLKVH